MTTNVEIKLTLKDAASAGMKKAAAESKKLQDKQLQDTQKTTTQSASAYAKMYQAREQLGIRSEHAIQREIQRTEAAYNRLARSGVASAKEIARAKDAQIRKTRELKKELDGVVSGYSKMQKVALGVGAAAGAYAYAKPAIDNAVSYDRTVASMTNTMYANRDTAGRVAGKTEIKAAIDSALSTGGGTREQAAMTLNELMGSGEFSKSQAFDLLGTIQKASTASGAESTDIAKIALSAKRMGIKPEDIDLAISKAIRGGQLGGFELTDMAKHLPAVLSSSKSLGLTGMAGFERAIAAMQSSVLTAGSKDEAANNLINILEKINSDDTAKDFAKQGINLRGELAKGAMRGEDTITTFTALVDRAIAKDPKTKSVVQELARLQKVAEDKKNPQREQALKQMEAIYSSGVIGKFLQDRQALQGFRAESEGAKSGLQKSVHDGLKRDNAGQELNTSYEVMSGTASSKLQQIENSKLKGQDEMLTQAGGVIKPLFDGMVLLSAEYPKLTASAVVLKDAMLAAAAAAILFGGGGKGGGGKGGGGKGGLPRFLEKVKTWIPAAATSVAAKVPSASTVAASVAPLATMYGVTEWAGNTKNDKARVSFLSDITKSLNNMFQHDPEAAQKAWRAKKDAELAGGGPLVELKQTIGLAPGLVITSQTSTAKNVKHQSNTGNIRSIP